MTSVKELSNDELLERLEDQIRAYLGAHPTEEAREEVARLLEIIKQAAQRERLQ